MYVIGSLGPGGSERQLVQAIRVMKNRNYHNIKVFCEFLDSETKKFYLNEVETMVGPVKTLDSEPDVLSVDNVPANTELINQLPM
ncbi:MAG: hypothetical protein HKN08_00380, partial [Gammaproteobacteria bacterium]|nr:hypothetical protein [Gammaproteobacteria bacterium]